MIPLQEWIVEFMRAIGAPGVGVAILLETAFPPIPSEVVLPLAGFTASQGHYGVVAAIVWATAGSLAGALLLYWAGAVWGVERVCRVADRLPLVDGADVHRAVAWFESHGRTAVLVGRFVPGVRSLVSIPAGIQRMRLVSFTVLTTVGSLVWNAALILAGYELGAQWRRVEAYVGDASYAVYVVLGAALAVFVVRRWRARRSDRPGGSAND
ncbi:DedA family protein [Nocardioides sp. GCM10027113]|uniref:DedA family protein n=1 Tax=unclassified Nocardioides TaxID=2615069 RepID=UPI00361CDE45